jgi:hypothetical protein
VTDGHQPTHPDRIVEVCVHAGRRGRESAQDKGSPRDHNGAGWRPYRRSSTDHGPAEPAPDIGSAHIHFVGTGGIAVDLDTQFLATGTDTYVAVGCVLGDSATLDKILNPELSGQYYINVHTALASGGAVQGALTA